MKRSKNLGRLLLGVWALWLFALQGTLASGLGAWVPDLGLLLLLALGARLPRRELTVAALVVAGARIAVGIDPPAAVLAGYLGAAWAARSVGELFDLEGSPQRALLSGLLALALALWWPLVHELRGAPPDGWLLGAAGASWRSALATALVALPAWPLLARLPGLGVLWRRA